MLSFSVAAHSEQDLSNDALSKAVQAVAEGKSSASSSSIGEKLDTKDKSLALMKETKSTLCLAAEKTSNELNDKSTTVNNLASQLYDEMERAQKGTSKAAADNAQKEYEEAADRAYSINQAYEEAKRKTINACGNGSPKEVEESLNSAHVASDLKSQAKEALLRNDTGGSWALEAESMKAELNSLYLSLTAEDDMRNTTTTKADISIKKMNELSEDASRKNQPELAKLLKEKATEMQTAIHGVKVCITLDYLTSGLSLLNFLF